MRKRNRNATMERAGLLAVELACNGLELIWRDLLQEDVGIDGTIEVAVGEFPTGKLVGAQVKSGVSYIRSETDQSFRFYPDKDDVVYWASVSIPMFLLVHDPRDGVVYWADLSKYIQERTNDPFGAPSVVIPKSNLLNSSFAAYLRARFDLLLYSSDQYAVARDELSALRHTFGDGESAVSISALDLFLEGLWGLCSKLQFHSSLMSELIRRAAQIRHQVFLVRYTFDHASLYPYLTAYFNLLSKHHLATLDANDINHSLYAKLEYPTFIAPLTTNGRKFTEYLRDDGADRVHDNQFFSLALLPVVQIEVYSEFSVVDGLPKFGPFTDVLGISFNSHLDYYHIEHWRNEQTPRKVWAQNIFLSELTAYIDHNFGALGRDNLYFRYLDVPLSPLICWLEAWNDNQQPMPGSALTGKSNAETAGFHDELLSIMGATGSATVNEPMIPKLPVPRLASGERLY